MFNSQFSILNPGKSYNPNLLRRNSKQLDQVPAQDCFLFGILQEWRLEDEVDRRRPVEGKIRAVHDLADAHLRNQMSQAFFTENHRVDKDLLPEILARMFFVGAIRVISYVAGHIGAAEV